MNKINSPFFLLLALLWLPQALLAESANLHPHVDIEQAVHDFVEQQITALDNSQNTESEITLGRLDSRLTLAKCENPLKVFSLAKFIPIGRNNIGVECTTPHYWKVYIPVSIKFFSTVVVAAKPLSRGTTLDVDDLTLDRRQITNHLGGYFTDLEQVIGRKVRRAIRLGDIIQENATEAAKWVKKGQIVTLRSGNSRFQVISSGKALSDGAEGEIVRVSNSKSQRVVEGTVVAPGIVEIRN